LDKYFRDLGKKKFIVAMVIISYIIIVPLIPLTMMLDVKNIGGPEAVKESPVMIEFLVVVLLAPFIETLIFQTIIFNILNKFEFFKKRAVIVIILSALAFGSAHGYSLIYVVMGTLMGFVLAYAYHIYIEKPESPYKIVTIIHSVRNLLAFTVALIFGV
jgi:membrane protease YdiL (CAAX protease family)